MKYMLPSLSGFEVGTCLLCYKEIIINILINLTMLVEKGNFCKLNNAGEDFPHKDLTKYHLS